VDGEERLYCCLGCSVAARIAGRAGAGGAGPSAVFLARIGLGFVLSMIVMMIQLVEYFDPEAAADETYRAFSPWAQWVATTPIVLFLGVPLLWGALAALRAGRVGADLLIGLGVLAGYVASTVVMLRGDSEPLWFDTVAGLATLVAVGRWMEASAKEKATEGLRAFLSSARRPARRLVGEGDQPPREEAVFADALRVGDRLRVLPGERLPADGVVRSGRALLDEAALTGEPLPRPVGPGDRVRGPAVPTDGALEVEVTAVGEETLLAQIGRVLARARADRSPAERLADRVSAVFVPLVLLLAVGSGAWRLLQGAGAEVAVLHGLAVLVVACPCALGIATPLAVTAALGRLAERGILVRSGAALAELPRVGTALFDKTGTLTEGRFRVASVAPAERAEEVLALAASLEQASEHPVARSLVDAARERGLVLGRCVESRVVPGRGIEGVVERGGAPARVRVGSGAWTGRTTERDEVVVERDGEALGRVRLADTLRPSARPALEGLARLGVRVEVLSGDDPRNVAALLAELGLSSEAGRGALLPDEKVAAVRERTERAGEGAVAFVGDGINDAPALAAADLGIAVGSGTDLARESAAVSLLGDDLTRLPGLLRAAARTRRAVAGNLAWAFLYNVVAVSLCVATDVPPVAAALAMVASSLSVVLNTVRLRNRLPDDLSGGA
jgi:heavy metal translocating P-type ATPase